MSAERIRGISRTSLWRAWKAVRQELKKASIRDVIDHLEYDVNPDKWINQLVGDVATGAYNPSPPARFTEAKSGGFSRPMTMPAIPDLVLYRAVVDYLYERARRDEVRNAYCERRHLPTWVKKAKASGEPVEPIWEHVSESRSGYEPSSKRSFRAWLSYHQYRRWLIFEEVFEYIVLTDVTNFFDSVLYDRVAECFHTIRAPPRMVSLLFFLLERLSIRDRFKESPRLGLPVDEFACSRKLAHIVLFPHDLRMVEQVGDEAYVRWMDDQNIGVPTRADGLRMLGLVDKSLRRLHLTPNSKKSKVLSLAEAHRHFHFDINEMLDEAEGEDTTTKAGRVRVRKSLRRAWKAARPHEGVGEWGKILKRFYRLAGSSEYRALRKRALGDVLKEPKLARRIADYMRCSGTVHDYLDFVRLVREHDEQVYPDVNRVLFETLLRVEASGNDALEVRRLASAVLSGKARFPGIEQAAPIAPLLILRFGDRRSVPLLRSCVRERRWSPAATRSAAVVLASYGGDDAAEVRQVASKLLRNDLATFVKMMDAIKAYKVVPKRFNLRCKPQFDAVCRSRYLDQRGLTAIRLLGLNRRKAVKAWLRDKKAVVLAADLTDFDRALVEKLWPGE